MTREEILKNRSEEAELTFGIQKFTDVEDAFRVMDNEWGEMWGHKGFTEIRIGTNAFLDQIYWKTVELFNKWLRGEYPEEKFLACLGFNDEYTTDELLDFNFFVYNKEKGCFYTSMMEFGDDYNSVLSDRQWEIFFEIYDTYRLGEYVTGIVKLLLETTLNEMKEWGDGTDNEDAIQAWFNTDGMWDEFSNLFADHVNLDKKYALFGQKGGLKLPKIIQSKYRLFFDPNLRKYTSFGEEEYYEDINPETKEEAYRHFIDIYESCQKKYLDAGHSAEDWSWSECHFYLRDNATGEKLYYQQIKREML